MVSSSGKLASIVERQMRNWELQKSSRAAADTAASPAESMRFYVAISREVGSDARDLADRLAERTGFEVFDRELLEYIAGHDDTRQRLLHTVDEQSTSWFETIARGISGQATESEYYFRHLTKTALAVVHNSHAIIIGRGANFMLPPEAGLSVRVVAPLEYRIDHYARQNEIDHDKAADDIRQIDRRRSQYMEDHFGKYPFDPRRYDLVINCASIPRESFADVVIAAMRAKNAPLDETGRVIEAGQA